MTCPLKFGADRWPFSAGTLLRQSEGSAILEFAVVLPLLVVFIAGIYDFGGAFNQKQKIEQAAQEGAIVAGAQPTSDLLPVATSASNPESLLPVVYAVFNSLQQSGVLTASCSAPGTATGPAGPPPTLTWQYTIHGCSRINASDDLVITINRGFVAATSTSHLDVVGTVVTVTFPYDWRFYSVIQSILPGAIATTSISESARVHNQM
jgi:TadE-like protein